MTMQEGAYKHQFTQGGTWKYETRCRKCNYLILREWPDKCVPYSEFRRELMTKWGDGLVIEVCQRCGVPTVQDIVALTPDPRELRPGTVEPSLGEGPTPAGGQAHGAGTDNTTAMARSTEHNLIISAKKLAALLGKTTDLQLVVRHVRDYPNGGNSVLQIEDLSIGVNSDEEFVYRLSHVQRSKLHNTLVVLGDQPVHIRFNLKSSYLELSNILI